MYINSIGQDFSSSIKLELFPGIDIPNEFYHVTIQYISDKFNLTEMHFSSFSSNNRSLHLHMGCDVYSISVTIESYNTSFFNKNHSYFHYSLRVDQLMLLNMAEKLLKK